MVPPGVVAAGPYGAQLPALLQHLGADRGAGRGPGGVRGHPRQDPPAAARGRGRRAAHRPPRRPRRPRRLPRGGCTRRPAAAGRSWRRSWRTGSSCPPPGRWRAPPATTPCGTSTGVFTDPAGAGELLGQYRRFAAPQTDRGGRLGGDGTAGGVQGDHARAGRRDRPADPGGEHALCAPSPEPALRDRAPWALRTALQELLVRMEVYRPYGSADAAAVVTEEAAAEARQAFVVPEEAGAVDVVRDLVLGRAGDGPDAGGVPDAVRADLVGAAGQVRGGHGVLPVCAAAVGDRGGREPGASGRVPGGVPRVLRARAARLAADGNGGVDARHQAQCRRAGGAGRAHRVPAAVGGRAGRGDPHRRGRAGPAAGVGGLADGVRARPRRPGAGAGGAAEACARGGPAHELDGAGARRTRRRWRRSSRPGRAGRRASGWPGCREPAGAAHPGQRAGRGPGAADDAGGAGRLPGHGGRVPGAGGPGQPAARAVPAPETRATRAR